MYNQPPQPNPLVQNNPSLEGKMDQLLNAFQAMNFKFQGQQQIMNSHTQSISKLESHMGQIANTLNKTEEGRLPGQVVGSPKGQCGMEVPQHE